MIAYILITRPGSRKTWSIMLWAPESEGRHQVKADFVPESHRSKGFTDISGIDECNGKAYSAADWVAGNENMGNHGRHCMYNKRGGWYRCLRRHSWSSSLQEKLLLEIVKNIFGLRCRVHLCCTFYFSCNIQQWSDLSYFNFIVPAGACFS